MSPEINSTAVAGSASPELPMVVPAGVPSVVAKSVKPGYKTTEFWLSLIVVVLSTITPLVGNYPQIAQIVGLALSLLASFGYTVSRTSIKNNI